MRLLTLTVLITLALDQLTKVGVVQVLDLKTRGQIDVLPPLLTLQMAWNRGVNFGLLSSDAGTTRWVLIAVALLLCALVLRWVVREGMDRLGQISAGLLVGGAIGNVIDRLIYGAVADFLNMSCCGFENPWSFNVADIAIFFGAAGLILLTGDTKKKAEVTGEEG